MFILDIDDIKKDVLELDNKIKGFKTYIQRELTELKKTEKDLLKKVGNKKYLSSRYLIGMASRLLL